MQPYVDILLRRRGEETSDALLALELKIARRADELVRLRGGGSDLNLYCWMLAEAEILGVVHAPPPQATQPLHT